jgi:hypothetical protein
MVIHRRLQADFATRNTVSGRGAHEEASREGGSRLGCSVSQGGRSWAESRLQTDPLTGRPRVGLSVLSGTLLRVSSVLSLPLPSEASLWRPPPQISTIVALYPAPHPGCLRPPALWASQPHGWRGHCRTVGSAAQSHDPLRANHFPRVIRAGHMTVSAASRWIRPSQLLT